MTAPLFSSQASASGKTARDPETGSAKVRFPRAAVGLDGGEERSWRRAVRKLCGYPWFDRSTDGQTIPPIAAPETFEALKAFAASGSAGCVKARERPKHATNAGLAAALGRSLPEALTQ